MKHLQLYLQSQAFGNAGAMCDGVMIVDFVFTNCTGIKLQK